MEHPGAVVMVPVNGDHVLMVRQPREAVEEYTLELPAGKLDGPDENPIDCAVRELAEEVGCTAGTWRDARGLLHGAGDPHRVHPLLHGDRPVARRGRRAADEDEAIEVISWPLADLEALIDKVRDAKTLIGLLRLERELRAAP